MGTDATRSIFSEPIQVADRRILKMQFNSDQYYRAGLERLGQARAIHDAGRSYALSMYCSGLSVECLLRAFRWREDHSFEGRHDLTELLKASRMLQINEEYMRSKRVPVDEIEEYGKTLRIAMNEVARLWHNNLRFASELSVRAYLGRTEQHSRIRGDVLKKRSLDLWEAASTIVNRGIALWDYKKR